MAVYRRPTLISPRKKKEKHHTDILVLQSKSTVDIMFQAFNKIWSQFEKFMFTKITVSSKNRV